MTAAFPYIGMDLTLWLSNVISTYRHFMRVSHMEYQHSILQPNYQITCFLSEHTLWDTCFSAETLKGLSFVNEVQFISSRPTVAFQIVVGENLTCHKDFFINTS